MTTPTERNRLNEEESPYLRDHADNPVNWQPWDEQALEAAREHDVPIFLSVGYAACHWCHVMAEESFDNDEIAAMLNENFVPIKVDREERPDIDRIYQSICQQVSGRGGWPLSVWLTPDQRPFYVGTYFPKEPKRGMPGFRGLLEDIRESWNDPEEREEIEERADEWTEAVESDLQSVPEEGQTPEGNVAETAAKAAVRSADREYGGWGSGPKFPHTGRLHLLFRAYEDTGRTVYLEVATETLDAMANGGMYDHVGGGFHRYATDRDWTVPHFEKMLYDNAELPRAYLAAYQLTNDEWYATVAGETLEFVERELTHEAGGFYSTLDAQSETGNGQREEGAFYVWTPESVHEVLDADDADLFCERYGVTERGNFEGKTVLTLDRSVADLAEERDVEESQLRERLQRVTEEVRTTREERARPPRDEKILAGWNGLAISAFAEGALVLDEKYAPPALAALEFVREQLWDAEEKRLQRRYKDGVSKIDGYLEDYAFLARGAFDLYQATGGVEQLAFALELADAIAERFWDAEEKTLYFTPGDGEQLITRPQEITDQSTPSSAGVAAELFAHLDHFRTDEKFATIADGVVETQGSKIRSNPLQHASLTLAADTVIDGSLELTLVADDPPEEWNETLAERYIGSRLLSRCPGTVDRMEEWLDTLDLDEEPPIWKGRKLKNDDPTVHACKAQTCSPPRHDIDRALGWADRIL